MTDKEAKQIAHGLIQGYIGPDHRVMDMPSFFGAIVQALQVTHQQGWKDRKEAERLTKKAAVSTMRGLWLHGPSQRPPQFPGSRRRGGLAFYVSWGAVFAVRRRL
jgi:hypothetical protein